MHNEKGAFEIFWKGKVSGPYSEEEITALIRKGEIGVWAEIREDGGKWQQLSKHPVLASRRKTKSSASPEKKKEPPSVPKIKKGKQKWKWKDRAEGTEGHREPQPEPDPPPDPTTESGHEEVQWFLQCFKGPDEGKRAALMPDTPLWIGDGEGVGIPSDDPDMSASIFGFELTNGHVWFNSSTDKTAYLDGVPMTQGTVHSGQQLRLGGSWWQLQINPKISNSANSTDDSGLLDKKIMSEQESTQEFQYAGFWIRVGATVIDTILIMLITLPPLIGIYGLEYFESTALVGAWDFWISTVLPAVAVIMFWIYKSATPGKMLTKIKIIDACNGGKLSAGQSIGRYLAYFISMIPLMLGIFWVGFDKKKQGWHDKLANTLVVKD